MLRAFSSRNFSLFYTGQAISLIGTSMTQVATSWLVYRLTDSALLLVTSMVGPAIAGLLIAAWGSGLCFLLDSISYVAVIIALLAIIITDKKAVISTRQPLEELKTSFNYAIGFLPIRSILIGSTLICCVWGF